MAAGQFISPYSTGCLLSSLFNGKSFLLQVAWIHIDRQMILTIHRHVISRVPRFSVSHDNAKTWLLHVSSVQQEDRGYYMCQVNTNPMISQVGYLQVVGECRCYLISPLCVCLCVSIKSQKIIISYWVILFSSTEYLRW